MTGNLKFNLERWLPKVVAEGVDLSPNETTNTMFSNICGPMDLYFSDYYRSRLTSDDVDFGNPVLTDLFIWSVGEPNCRYATKCGGLPYRSARKLWPMSEEGRSMHLLAQFNFCDSIDLTGELPGQLLLIFGNNRREGIYDGVYEFYSEWQNIDIDIDDLVQEAPDDLDELQPCFGSICRKTVFPNAEFKRHPIIDGVELFGCQHLVDFPAWQIGGIVSPIQESQAPHRSRFLCRVNSLLPRWSMPYPFLNVPNGIGYQPERLFDNPSGPFIHIGDCGCVDVYIDEESGDIYAEEASY